mmetsp:Transcript_29891/g.85625  ORF Transcript_29891/g.85625 Transcript_29891/m.85625 type:complete len:234 (-) Transcript_29891:164-865(-)
MIVGIVDGDLQVLQQPREVQAWKILLRGLEDPGPRRRGDDGHAREASGGRQEALHQFRVSLQRLVAGEVLRELAAPADPGVSAARAVAAGERRRATLWRADLDGVHDEACGEERVVPVEDQKRRLPQKVRRQGVELQALGVVFRHAVQQWRPRIVRQRPRVEVAFVLAGRRRAALRVRGASEARGRRLPSAARPGGLKASVYVTHLLALCVHAFHVPGLTIDVDFLAIYIQNV